MVLRSANLFSSGLFCCASSLPALHGEPLVEQTSGPTIESSLDCSFFSRSPYFFNLNCDFLTSLSPHSAFCLVSA